MKVKPLDYGPDVDVTELRRRTVGLTVDEENYPELAGFRAPGEGKPPRQLIARRRKKIKRRIHRASNA